MSLSNAQIRKLKGLAQHLDPVLHVGREGVTDAFLKSMDASLEIHELVKIKFVAHKEEKKELAPQIAEKTSAALVMQVGHVAVFYREATDPERRKISVAD